MLTVICAPQVACGNATKKHEDATGTTIAAVSEESAVADVLGKVISGLPDAGLANVTDAAGVGDQVVFYRLPRIRGGRQYLSDCDLEEQRERLHRSGVRTLVTSAAGGQVLAEAGFAAP